MTVQDFEQALLALAAWREAGNDNIDTMLCVAYTILNLAKRDGIGVGEAIVAHREMHHLEWDEENYPDVRDPRVAKMLQRVSEVFSPYSEDLSNGSVYYIDLSKPVPEYMAFLLKDGEAHPRVATCGTKHFFK